MRIELEINGDFFKKVSKKLSESAKVAVKTVKTKKLALVDREVKKAN